MVDLKLTLSARFSARVMSDEFDRYNRKIGFWAETKGRKGETKITYQQSFPATCSGLLGTSLLDTSNCTCHDFP